VTAQAIAVGAALIREFESCSLVPYLCPANYPTIGWGMRFRADGSRVTMDDPAVSQAEADSALTTAVAAMAGRLDRELPIRLNSNQRGALYSFAWNLGEGALQKSTLLRLLISGDDAGAAREFGRWVNVAGKPVSGLIRRRAREAEVFVA
jgi:lysozyme